MKKTFFILAAIILLTGCSPADKKIENIKTGLSECDGKQAVVNMPIWPGCCVKIFKENNWSKEEAKRYLKENRNVDVDKLISEGNEYWKNAWENY